MTVETATQFSELNPALPADSDLMQEWPQHSTLIKTLLKTLLGSLGATPLAVTAEEINFLDGVGSAIQTQINTLNTNKADVSGETYTGEHDFTGAVLRSATQPLSDSSDKVATMAALAAAALAGSLPGLSGTARKWAKSDGTSVAWQYLSLDTETITTNTVAVPGKYYVIATAGITLTIPATFNTNEPVGFGMSRGITNAYVDWSTNKLKGRTPGVMTLTTQNDAAVVTFAGATDGFVEA